MNFVFNDVNPYTDVVPPTKVPRMAPAARIYEDLAMRTDARLIIEVGAGQGLSAARLADFLKRRGDGVLFAVGSWLGTREDWSKDSLDMLAAKGYPRAYYTFLSNIVSWGFVRYVVPFPTTSQTAARHLASKGPQADLVHISAVPPADALKEIKVWWPLARPCGVLLGESVGFPAAFEEFTNKADVDLFAVGERSTGMSWFFRKPGPDCGVQRMMKLVVNSHVRYWKPLNFLLRSLVEAKWTRWDDVIIFFGGSRRNIPPYKALHSWAPGGITIANLTLNNYDYNGLAGLYRFRDHVDLQADAYMYTHDTSTVAGNFTSYFEKASRDFQIGELRAPWSRSSNVFIFSSDLPQRYKDNFDVNLTKFEAVALEIEGPQRITSFKVRGVRYIGYFANRVHRVAERIPVSPAIDIYGTGYPRQRFFYKNFGITKYLLSWLNGDILGEVKLTAR